MSNVKTILDVPKEPAVRRAWVIYQLSIRGRSLRQLALSEGVYPQAMSTALVAPNVHLEPVIAKAIGLTVEQLFPERFDDTGRRIARTREKSRSTPATTPRNGKGERAA